MRFSKYIVLLFMMVVIGVSSIIISNANKVEIADSSEVIRGYNKLINQDGIEHLILNEKDNMTLEIFRDRKSGRERTDYFDENGLLVNRTITNDYGASFFILSQYSDEIGKWEYSLSKTLPPKNAVEENKDLLKKSIIDGYLVEEFTKGMDLNWEKSEEKADIIKYSDKNHNIYIDSKNGLVKKREIILKNEVVKTIDVEILSYDNKEVDSLFEINAPLLKNNSIKADKDLDEIIKGLKVKVDDNTNVEYDPNNAKG